jgi:hypothetical protein
MNKTISAMVLNVWEVWTENEKWIGLEVKSFEKKLEIIYE